MKKSQIRILVQTALMAALIFLGTYIIRIPVGNGYIHIGDGFVYLASLLPLPYAMAAGAVGGALSDLIAGYAVYIPITAIVKALAALTVWLIMRSEKKLLSSASALRIIIAAVCGGAVNIAGYFLAECLLYGVGGAAAGIGGNAVQAAAGLVVFMLVYAPARRAQQYFKEQ